MIYNKERHKQLVIRSKDLNREEDLELTSYNVEVEEQVFWTHREKFVRIMKDFLDNILDFDQFETAFSFLSEEVTKEVDMFKIDLEKINNFQPSTRSYRFASLVGAIYRQFEEIQDEYCTEQEAKEYVKECYLEFQKFEE